MSIKWRFNHLFVFALLLVIATNSRAAQKGYSIEELAAFQQINSASVVTGYSPLGYAEYDINAKVDTGGASLSAAPILGLPGATSTYPGGSVTFPTGTNFSPTLPSTLAGNQVVVAWPTWIAGWTLQTNNNLATGTWGNYFGPVSNNSVTNSPSTGNLFFRVMHP